MKTGIILAMSAICLSVTAAEKNQTLRLASANITAAQIQKSAKPAPPGMPRPVPAPGPIPAPGGPVHVTWNDTPEKVRKAIVKLKTSTSSHLVFKETRANQTLFHAQFDNGVLSFDLEGKIADSDTYWISTKVGN